MTEAVAALEVAGPYQFRENQDKTIQKVESQAAPDRESVLELKWKHLEWPVASTPVTQSEPPGKIRPKGLHLDVGVAAERGLVMGELSAGAQWRSLRPSAYRNASLL
jgi:hypothetical protein